MKNKLVRKLQSKHLNMIAIGGSIGTGLFIASGVTIAEIGPIGAILSYLIVGLIVYFLMTSLCELTSYMPTSGSFAKYASIYVDDAFGFALGWNYWYNWIITIVVDLFSIQIIMNYWFPNIPKYIWSLLFILIIFFFNFFSVKNFGKIEYYLSLIKIVSIIIFIIVGLLILMGMLKYNQNYGFQLWNIQEKFIIGNFSSIFNILIIVSFSFQGIELLGVTSGEIHNPKKNIQHAIWNIFLKIFLFYILTIFILSLLISYNNPNLLKNDLKDIVVSPFTLIFKESGIPGSAFIMNIVILISIISAGNTGIYASTRMLYSLSIENKAPKLFSLVSKYGVPRNSLYFNIFTIIIIFLISLLFSEKIYFHFINASGITGIIVWLGIAISHYRFRIGYIKQNLKLNKLVYVAKYFPLGPICVFIFCILVIIFQNYKIFLLNFKWSNFFLIYSGFIFFIITLLSYKIINKNKFIKYKNISFKK